MGTPRQRGARRGACQEVICRLAVGSTFSWRGLTSRAPVRATTKSRGDRTWTAGTAVSRIKRLQRPCCDRGTRTRTRPDFSHCSERNRGFRWFPFHHPKSNHSSHPIIGGGGQASSPPRERQSINAGETPITDGRACSDPEACKRCVRSHRWHKLAHPRQINSQSGDRGGECTEARVVSPSNYSLI